MNKPPSAPFMRVTLSSFCSSPIKAACIPIEVRTLARSWISEFSREVAKEQLVNQTHLPNIEDAYDREGLKITNFSEAVGCETKTSFPSNKLTMASCCVSLNFSIWKRSNTHFTEENSSALISAMLDRQVTEMTNHREACSIRAGSSVIGQEIHWVDQ